MIHFPVNGLAPGLLTHPATSTATFEHLKRWQIGGLILKGDKATGPQQGNHLGGFGEVSGDSQPAD